MTLRPGPSSAWASAARSPLLGAASPGLSRPMGKVIRPSSLVITLMALSSARCTSAVLASSKPIVATSTEARTPTRVKVMTRRARSPVGNRITEG